MEWAWSHARGSSQANNFFMQIDKQKIITKTITSWTIKFSKWSKDTGLKVKK